MIFIEDSQGNINPYAVTSYAMNYKDEADHGSFWREDKHNNGQLNTTGLIFRFKMEIPCDGWESLAPDIDPPR